jgi:Flp pilus assembly protein TadG
MLSRFRKEEKGAITVEYAICLPVVIMMLGVLLFVGNIAFLQIKCSNASSQVARNAILLSDPVANKNSLESIMQNSLGKTRGSLNVNNLVDNLIEVEVTIDIDSWPLNLAKKQVSSKIVSMIEE